MLCDDLRRLKELSGKSQDEISALSGISKSTLSKIMAGVTKQPSIEAVKAIVYAMGFRLQDLDNVDVEACENPCTPEELGIIKKYRTLDEHGKRMVDFVLDEEYNRILQSTRTIHIAARGGGVQEMQVDASALDQLSQLPEAEEDI